MPMQRGIPPRLHKLCNSLRSGECECFYSHRWPLLCNIIPSSYEFQATLAFLVLEAPSVPALDVEVNSEATEHESIEEVEMIYNI
jgi:hypothetical protein